MDQLLLFSPQPDAESERGRREQEWRCEAGPAQRKQATARGYDLREHAGNTRRFGDTLRKISPTQGESH